MKIIGTVLMWLGFLSGSLATVFNLPAAGVEHVKKLDPSNAVGFELQDLSAVEVPTDGWHLIPWTWFGISLAVCLVGVALIRISMAQSADAEGSEMESNLDTIRDSLESLRSKARRLDQQVGKLAPSKISAFIDDELADDFRAFADGRECMIPRFGLTVYADVMTHFASGERYMNRAWSAAADGYVDEAATCIQQSIGFLDDATAELDRAAKND